MTIACPKCGYKLHQFDMTTFKILELVVAFDWRTLNEDETIRYKPVFGNIPMDGARALETSDGDRLIELERVFGMPPCCHESHSGEWSVANSFGLLIIDTPYLVETSAIWSESVDT